MKFVQVLAALVLAPLIAQAQTGGLAIDPPPPNVYTLTCTDPLVATDFKLVIKRVQKRNSPLTFHIEITTYDDSAGHDIGWYNRVVTDMTANQNTPNLTTAANDKGESMTIQDLAPLLNQNMPAAGYTNTYTPEAQYYELNLLTGRKDFPRIIVRGVLTKLAMTTAFIEIQDNGETWQQQLADDAQNFGKANRPPYQTGSPNPTFTNCVNAPSYAR